MRWDRGRRRSGKVIDVRGASSGSSSGGFPGLGGIPGGLGGLGGGAGIVVVLVVVALQVFGGGGSSGIDLTQIFGPGFTAPGADDPAPLDPSQDPDKDLFDFSAYVFDDVQATWEAIFEQEGATYESAEMVVYSEAVQTEGCGGATSAVGPFYCPADGRVYLDLSFYEDMRSLGLKGDEFDFAWAYIIGHEVGHHIQSVKGVSGEVDRLSSEDPDRANDLSVRQELQADCYSGVWAATVFAEGDLEAGDLDEAFSAAEAVGDDRLQSRTGSVNPDSFTHGTSEQRRTWFNNGLEAGNPAACDTFSGDI
jgi:hypothetical protein